MARRRYTSLDMVRMALFARENPKLLGLNLLAAYDKKYPELTKEEIRNNVKSFLETCQEFSNNVLDKNRNEKNNNIQE